MRAKRNLLASVLCLLLLVCGCSKQNATLSTTLPKSHIHDFASQWEHDPQSHWPICHCGQIDAPALHTFSEGVCTICGYEKPLDPTQVKDLAHWQWLCQDGRFANVTCTLERGTAQGVMISQVRVDGTRVLAAVDLASLEDFDAARQFYRLLDNGYEHWNIEVKQWQQHLGQGSGLQQLLQDLFGADLFQTYLLPYGVAASYDGQTQTYVLENQEGRHEIWVRDGLLSQWRSEFVDGTWLQLTFADYGKTAV